MESESFSLTNRQGIGSYSGNWPTAAAELERYDRTRLEANSLSPDGQLLAFTDGVTRHGDIWSCAEYRKAQPFLQTPLLN